MERIVPRMLSNLIKGSINAVYGYTVETISMPVKVISDTPDCTDHIPIVDAI